MDTGAEGQDQSGDGETADAQPWVGGSSVVMCFSVVTCSVEKKFFVLKIKKFPESLTIIVFL